MHIPWNPGPFSPIPLTGQKLARLKVPIPPIQVLLDSAMNVPWSPSRPPCHVQLDGCFGCFQCSGCSGKPAEQSPSTRPLHPARRWLKPRSTMLKARLLGTHVQTPHILSPGSHVAWLSQQVQLLLSLVCFSALLHEYLSRETL